MEYDEEQSAVTYHSDKPTGPTAGSETTDALEFLAKLTSLFPNKGQVLQRYYGHYASRVRGKRRKAGEGDEVYEEPPLVTVEPEPEGLRKAKRRWAELLRRILEVDPHDDVNGLRRDGGSRRPARLPRKATTKSPDVPRYGSVGLRS